MYYLIKTIIVLLVFSMWIISTEYFSLLGVYNYLIWFILILITSYIWSFTYSILFTISTSSFDYMNIESNSVFISEMLPLIFAITAIIIVISFFIKYMPTMNNDFHRDDRFFGFY